MDSILFLSVLGLILLVYGVQQGYELIVNLRQPMQTETAYVVGKRKQEEQGSGWLPATHFFITFERVSSGRMCEYLVSEADFSRLREGMHGTLQTRGAWYRGFRT